VWVHAECDKISSNHFKVYPLLLICRYCHFSEFKVHKVTYDVLLIGIFSVSLKDLETTDYFCPTCRGKFDFELSDSEYTKPKVK